MLQRSRRLRLLLGICVCLGGAAALAACGKEEMPGFAPTGHSTGGNGHDNAGSGGDDQPDGGEPDSGSGGEAGGSAAGTGGEAGSDQGGTGGMSGSGGSAGSDTGGTGGTAGNPDDNEPEPPPVPESPANPWIAFTQFDGLNHLWVVKADGTGLKQYKTPGLYEADPSWSHDGTKLVFVRVEDAEELHIADFDGGSDDVVPCDLQSITRPRWSPDDSTLVVSAREGDTGKVSLYRVDPESGDFEPITDASGGMGDTGLDVGPTGRVFYVRTGNPADVFSIMYTSSPSSAPTRVTTDSKIVGGVTVHPDSLHITYARSIGADATLSTELVELTLAGGERVIGDDGDEEPDYFAGADKIVINRDSTGGDGEIVVTDAEGVLDTSCTDDTDNSNSPSVSPIDSGDVDISAAF